MSRIGNKPIAIPEKVEVSIKDMTISVKGPKGELSTTVVDERITFEVNEGTENIGARRLHTILERLLEDISYNASDLGSKDEKISINKAFVEKNLGELASNEDLTRFIL